MVFLKPANECVCAECPGAKHVPPRTLGGMKCLCQCHMSKPMMAEERADKVVGWMYQNAVNGKLIFLDHIKAAEAAAREQALEDAAMASEEWRCQCASYECCEGQGVDEAIRALKQAPSDGMEK